MSLQYTGATVVDRPKKRGTFTRENRPPGGRKPGVPNKVTKEAKELAHRLLNDPEYKRSFEESWRARKVAPQIEMMVWHYAYGKPKETVQHEVGGQPQMLALIQELPPEEQKRLGEAMASLFRARLKAGDVVDVEANEVE